MNPDDIPQEMDEDAIEHLRREMQASIQHDEKADLRALSVAALSSIRIPLHHGSHAVEIARAANTAGNLAEAMIEMWKTRGWLE